MNTKKILWTMGIVGLVTYELTGKYTEKELFVEKAEFISTNPTRDLYRITTEENELKNIMIEKNNPKYNSIKQAIEKGNIPTKATYMFPLQRPIIQYIEHTEY